MYNIILYAIYYGLNVEKKCYTNSILTNWDIILTYLVILSELIYINIKRMIFVQPKKGVFQFD